MGNQPLGDNEPQMPQEHNVTAHFKRTAQWEVFPGGKNGVSGLQEYKVQIVV